MFVFAITLLFAAFSSGLVEGTCTCGPQQWEGLEYTLTGGHSAQGNDISQQITNLSYNAVDKKIALNTTIIGSKGNTTTSHVLMDYQKGILYAVSNGVCFNTSIATAFPLNCLPAGAKKVSDTYLGTGSDSLATETYVLPSTDQTSNFLSVTKECIAIGEVTYGQRDNVKFLSIIGFSGITVGIKNPSVFDVPAACRGQRLIYEKDALHRIRHTRRKNTLGF